MTADLLDLLEQHVRVVDLQGADAGARRDHPERRCATEQRVREVDVREAVVAAQRGVGGGDERVPRLRRSRVDRLVERPQRAQLGRQLGEVTPRELGLVTVDRDVDQQLARVVSRHVRFVAAARELRDGALGLRQRARVDHPGRRRG